VLYGIDLAELKRRINAVLGGSRSVLFRIPLVDRDASE
jgi:hypothetical protein